MTIKTMTILYDADCRICRRARDWLSTRETLVPLEFVAAASPAARRRFPQLDPDATLRDLTVITDGGLVYSGDAAWFACLWALTRYRDWAERLSGPSTLPIARRLIATASAARARDLARYRGDDADDGDCDDACH
jgi:predicted DCC family thiol-disulfide oxidoreductase YuxK